MNTDDRQQHIDTLARAMAGVVRRSTSDGTRLPTLEERVARIFDSTDPAVHDALTAALHANADRARVLAAHADAGWLDEEWGVQFKGIGTPRSYAPDEESARAWASIPGDRVIRRLVTPWEPTP